jgi:hypothetical protein
MRDRYASACDPSPAKPRIDAQRKGVAPLLIRGHALQSQRKSEGRPDTAFSKSNPLKETPAFNASVGVLAALSGVATQERASQHHDPPAPAPLSDAVNAQPTAAMALATPVEWTSTVYDVRRGLLLVDRALVGQRSGNVEPGVDERGGCSRPCGACPSVSSRSPGETPSPCAMASTVDNRGSCFPRSKRPIAEDCMPDSLARWSCVRPCRSRSSRTRRPNAAAAAFASNSSPVIAGGGSRAFAQIMQAPRQIHRHTWPRNPNVPHESPSKTQMSRPTS